MNNKNIFIMNIIRSIIFLLIVLWLFFKNTGLMKIIIIPFIVCGLAIMGKNICLLMNKNKYANIFSKLYVITFLVFWFGFLIWVDYSTIKNNQYGSTIFTIPFWLIGIYFVRKKLFKTNKESVIKPIMSKFNFSVVVGCFLIGITLIIGIVCLFIGITETYKSNEIAKNYITTDGYFSDYTIYNSDEDGITYELIYTYTVNGEEYTISTNYGTNHIPEENSIREVKYNPNNPDEAVLVGTNDKNFLIYFGAFFTLGAMAFIIAILQTKGVFDKVKIDVVGLYFGIVFFIIGVGIILFQNGTTSSFLETIKSLGLWILIPILFIIVGLIQTIKCLFFKQTK